MISINETYSFDVRQSYRTEYKEFMNGDTKYEQKYITIGLYKDNRAVDHIDFKEERFETSSLHDIVAKLVKDYEARLVYTKDQGSRFD